MILLPEKQVQAFMQQPASEFFWLQEGQHRKVAFRYPKEETSSEFYNPLLYASDTLSVSIVRIGKVMTTSTEVGLYIEIPNLPCELGRNYVTITRKQTGVRQITPVPTLRINRFTMLEVPNEALTIVCDNSGNFQI